MGPAIEGEDKSVKPKKSDISVTRLALLWMP
jgi:hypothetical protein